MLDASLGDFRHHVENKTLLLPHAFAPLTAGTQSHTESHRVKHRLAVTEVLINRAPMDARAHTHTHTHTQHLLSTHLRAVALVTRLFVDRRIANARGRLSRDSASVARSWDRFWTSFPRFRASRLANFCLAISDSFKYPAPKNLFFRLRFACMISQVSPKNFFFCLRFACTISQVSWCELLWAPDFALFFLSLDICNCNK